MWRTSPSPNVVRKAPPNSPAEKFLNPAERGYEGVDFVHRAIQREARAGRARETEFVHQRLVAVMAAALTDSNTGGDSPPDTT